MSSETGLEDASLIDLFRSEVETHSEVLSAALLALERSPDDTTRIDEMMRAAHSIKGAARIVGVDPAARVAHVMEDCFIAVQKGTITFSEENVDVLLRGVDLLGKISEATRDPNADVALAFSAPVQQFLIELETVLSGRGESAGGHAASEKQAVAALAVNDVTISFPEILDAAAAEEIRKRFVVAIDSQSQIIRFDMKATKDLDVQGLAFLAAVPRHLAQHSRSLLQLAGISIEMATVLRVTGLGEAYGVRR
jgi:chemotaxis protein histidine kinase CheA